MSPAVLEDFHTYDLARVTAALAEAADEYPETPATQALRAACIRRLSWDHAYRDPWADPTFLPRYLYLRQAITTQAPGGERATVTAAIPVLDTIVQDAVRLEQTF